MPQAWRIVKSKHAAMAFDGEGAARIHRLSSRAFASLRNAAMLSGFDRPFEPGKTCLGSDLYGSGKRM